MTQNVVVEIIKQKLKTLNVADAMVERYQWEALMASTKLNSSRLVHVPSNSIGLELYFIASSLLTNHTFVFEPDANAKICNWMDELTLASNLYIPPSFLHIYRLKNYYFIIGARWDQIDSWLSSRLAKSIDQTARIAAQLCHIEMTMEMLKQFINENNNFNTFGPISFDIYCKLADYIEGIYPPVNSTMIEINGNMKL